LSPRQILFFFARFIELYGNIIEEQLNNLIEAVKVLATAVNQCCEKKPDDAEIEKIARKVVELEKKGDRLKEKFTEYLYGGGSVHFSKPDKLYLSLQVDKILDFAELSAQYLLVRPKGLTFDETIVPDVKALSSKVVETIEALRTCLILINSNFDEAREKARVVEDLRRDVRNLEWNILKNLLNSGDIDAKTLLIKQFIEFLAIIADKAESVSDSVDALALKYKTLM